MFQIATAKHIDEILGLMHEHYLAEGYPFDELVVAPSHRGSRSRPEAMSMPDERIIALP